MKKYLCGALALAMLTGCSSKASSTTSSTASLAADGPISLTVWGSETDQDYLAERIEAFKKKYSDYEFNIQIGVESESTAKDTILTDVEAAADVYAFADDQLPDLVEAGAILALDDNMDAVLQTYANKSLDDIKNDNVEVSVDSATYNNQLYAFPTSADNGYFLYYDSTVFSEDDVKDWSSLLAAASKKGNGRKVGMTLASGWYLSGFFYGAGFTTDRNADGSTAIDWTETKNGVSGSDVVLGISKIATDSSFMAIADGDISNQIASGNLCAVVSGTWDGQAAQGAFGNGYAATILPKYTAGSKSIQMGSVTGCKLMGVNPHSKNTGWAVLLAEFLTNEESQTVHFNEKEIGPSNKKAQQSEEVQKNVALAAVLAQSEYAVIQKAGGNFWTPTQTFGEKIAQGTITDEATAKSALEELVAGVSQPVSQ